MALALCVGCIACGRIANLFAAIEEDSKLKKRREGKENKTGFWGRDQLWPVRGPVGPSGPLIGLWK